MPGDGCSCQFEAVGDAACGTFTISDTLRARAVGSIQDNWEQVGQFALAEVALQSGRDFNSLTKDLCCELLLGSDDRPLWGNHVTLAQLPNIVNKRIVVLTLSSGKPFKYLFDCEDTENTIYIGLVPEAHYFPLIPKRGFQKGDKGLFIFEMNLSS